MHPKLEHQAAHFGEEGASQGSSAGGFGCSDGATVNGSRVAKFSHHASKSPLEVLGSAGGALRAPRSLSIRGSCANSARQDEQGLRAGRAAFL